MEWVKPQRGKRNISTMPCLFNWTPYRWIIWAHNLNPVEKVTVLPKRRELKLVNRLIKKDIDLIKDCVVIKTLLKITYCTRKTVYIYMQLCYSVSIQITVAVLQIPKAKIALLTSFPPTIRLMSWGFIYMR